ncbi:leptin a isoform X2 [Pimephales promelas]|uniref:leptin a isoform X2 n=1 Tax=Pimephales promelas TaxID=90988 RepID=UPI001955CF47|nr:leptin a isoform X2 [Pimephales promelas]
MYFPALLYTCISSMLFLIDGIPIHPPDSLKNVMQLRLHPNLHIGNSELDVLAEKPIRGLGSIVDTLTTIQKVLQKLPKGHVSQLHISVSNLLGYFNERMTFMHCTPKEPANGRSLDAFLEENANHHITLGYSTLDILKKFLQKLIDNLDQLKNC